MSIKIAKTFISSLFFVSLTACGILGGSKAPIKYESRANSAPVAIAPSAPVLTVPATPPAPALSTPSTSTPDVQRPTSYDTRVVAQAPATTDGMQPKGVSAVLTHEEERTMSQGVKNSINLDIIGVPVKFVNKMWKEYAKQFKGDIKNKNDEWFSNNAFIPTIGGANSVDMYAKFEESGKNTNATVWYDLGGNYLNTKDDATKFKEGEKILLDFNAYVQRELTTRQLSDEQEALSKLEKYQRNLERKNSDLHTDIEDYNKRIKRAETDIVINNQQQTDAKFQIENQRRLVDTLQNSFSGALQTDLTRKQLTDQQNALNKFEKQQRNLERKNTDLYYDIEDYRKKISRAESDIVLNLKQQDDIKKQVVNQRLLVDEIQKKLSAMN